MTRVEAVAAASSQVDEAGIAATTAENVRHHIIEDGEDPDAPPGDFRPVPDVQAIRKRLSMSQATVRNREQRRTGVAPSARTLLRMMGANPQRCSRLWPDNP